MLIPEKKVDKAERLDTIMIWVSSAVIFGLTVGYMWMMSS